MIKYLAIGLLLVGCSKPSTTEVQTGLDTLDKLCRAEAKTPDEIKACDLTEKMVKSQLVKLGVIKDASTNG